MQLQKDKALLVLISLLLTLFQDASQIHALLKTQAYSFDVVEIFDRISLKDNDPLFSSHPGVRFTDLLDTIRSSAGEIEKR